MHIKSKRSVFWKVNLLCLLFFTSFSSIIAQNNVLVENTFEKGTEKWETRGERVSISSSKDQFANGAKSLKISGRSANWQGTQLNISRYLQPKKTYKFTVSVKLVKGENPDLIKMTLQRGDTGFNQVGSALINPDGWTVISGKYTYSGGDPYILVYIEADRANTSYFIDDFKLEDLGDDIPNQSGVILKNDFEDLTAQNWFVLGENVGMFSSNAFGVNSLKVSGRTANWHGLALDVSPILYKGRTYQMSVSARLVKGQKSDSLKLTMKETSLKGEAKYTEVSQPVVVSDTEWKTISGNYTPTTTDNNLVIYVEAAGATTAFHIDNFIVQIPEKSPNQ